MWCHFIFSLVGLLLVSNLKYSLSFLCALTGDFDSFIFKVIINRCDLIIVILLILFWICILSLFHFSSLVLFLYKTTLFPNLTSLPCCNSIYLLLLSQFFQFNHLPQLPRPTQADAGSGLQCSCFSPSLHLPPLPHRFTPDGTTLQLVTVSQPLVPPVHTETGSLVTSVKLESLPSLSSVS